MKLLKQYRKIIVISAIVTVFLLNFSPVVQAMDVGQAIESIKEFFSPLFLKEPEESEFLLRSEYKDFKAYFGDKKNYGQHRVMIAKGDFIIDFSFVETKFFEEAVATPSSLSTLGISTNSASLDNLSAEQATVAADWIKQLESIKESQATISSKLEELKEEVASIDKAVKKIVPNTQISYDELANNQIVVKNGQIAPGIDIYYWKREEDLREKIIIREPPAVSEISFILKTNLIPFDIGAGVIYFKDRDGNYQFRITKGYVKDLTNAFSNEVDTEIVSLPPGQGYKLIHKLDPKWLADSQRVFPLTIYFDFQVINSGKATPVAPVQTITPPELNPTLTIMPTPIIMTEAIMLTPTFMPTLSVQKKASPSGELTPTVTITPLPTKVLVTPELTLTPIQALTSVPSKEAEE